MADVCEPQGMCLLQQQLMAQSLIQFGNLVTTSHAQDTEYLKSTQMMTLAAIGNVSPNNQVVTLPATA